MSDTQKTTLPYELQCMNLEWLQATIKLDGNGQYYVEINNPKFKKLYYSRTASVQLLKLYLRTAMYYFMLENNMIRYCKVCKCALIVDERKYIDVCENCLTAEDDTSHESEYQKVTKDFIKVEQKKPEAAEKTLFDMTLDEVADGANY